MSYGKCFHDPVDQGAGGSGSALPAVDLRLRDADLTEAGRR